MSSFSPVSNHLIPRARCRALQAAGWLLLACAAFLAASLPLRAQTPGTLDPTFVPGFGDSTGFALFLNAPLAGDAATRVLNEEILVGGDRAGFANLTSTGLADANAVDPGFGNAGRVIYTIVQEPPGLPDSPLLVGGLFGRNLDQINNKLPGLNIARLNADGTVVDPASFNVGAGANGFVTAILPQTNPADATLPNVIVVGGQFTQFNAISHNHIVRLTDTGAIDPGFNPGLDIDADVLSLAAQTDAATGLPNGQILVAGTFGQVGGAAHTKLARLNFDGSVDGTFNPAFDGRVVIVTAQPDGKILVGGDFLTVNGKAASHVARLNRDGSLDTGFAASVSTEPSGLNFPPAVYVIRVLPDGRIFLGGNFAKVNGVTRNFLGRVNADGMLDGFDPGNSLPNPVQSLAIQADNKLLLGMDRTISVNGARPPTLVRLYGDPAPIATNAALPSVGVSATVPIASRTLPGRVVFTRTGADNTAALSFGVKADAATLGSYKLRDSNRAVINKSPARIFTVTIPAGAASVEFQVTPTSVYAFAVTNPALTAKFTVLPDANATAAYTVGVPSKARVTLQRKQ